MLLSYILVIVFSVGLATLILKFILMRLTDLYEQINIILWLVMIAIFIFAFYPKYIDTQYEDAIPNKVCNCFGYDHKYKNTDFQIVRECFGVKSNCATIEQFKIEIRNNPELCINNKFFSNADSCYLDIAKEIAQKATSDSKYSFYEAFNFCNRITDSSVKNDCLVFVATLERGGVIF